MLIIFQWCYLHSIIYKIKNNFISKFTCASAPHMTESENKKNQFIMFKVQNEKKKKTIPLKQHTFWSACVCACMCVFCCVC